MLKSDSFSKVSVVVASVFAVGFFFFCCFLLGFDELDCPKLKGSYISKSGVSLAESELSDSAEDFRSAAEGRETFSALNPTEDEMKGADAISPAVHKLLKVGVGE